MLGSSMMIDPRAPRLPRVRSRVLIHDLPWLAPSGRPSLDITEAKPKLLQSPPCLRRCVTLEVRHPDAFGLARFDRDQQIDARSSPDFLAVPWPLVQHSPRAFATCLPLVDRAKAEVGVPQPVLGAPEGQPLQPRHPHTFGLPRFDRDQQVDAGPWPDFLAVARPLVQHCPGAFAGHLPLVNRAKPEVGVPKKPLSPVEVEASYVGNPYGRWPEHITLRPGDQRAERIGGEDTPLGDAAFDDHQLLARLNGCLDRPEQLGTACKEGEHVVLRRHGHMKRLIHERHGLLSFCLDFAGTRFSPDSAEADEKQDDASARRHNFFPFWVCFFV
jgi:hypothetical protein